MRDNLEEGALVLADISTGGSWSTPIQSFADEGRLLSAVQEIGERLQARTGITFTRSRWPIV